MTGVDPVGIRRDLERARERGIAFDDAWRDAMSRQEPTEPEREFKLVGFMRDHFEAAYYNHAKPLGECKFSRGDTSGAVKRIAPDHNAVRDFEFCRSGDGCSRAAVRGRFGRMWCDYHAAELERLSESMEIDLERYDPRKSGNASLFQDRQRAA